MASASASCPPGGTKISWNVTGPAGPAGSTGATGPQGKPGQAIAARQYNCATQVVAQSQFVTFTDSGVGFGTTLPTSTMPFTNFLLQPGTYQVHLSISQFTVSINSSLFFGFTYAGWYLSSGLNPAPPVSGDRLISVTSPNTGVVLGYSAGSPSTLSINALTTAPCVLILTQLQYRGWHRYGDASRRYSPPINAPDLDGGRGLDCNLLHLFRSGSVHFPYIGSWTAMSVAGGS